MSELEAFRAEVSTWLSDHAPRSLFGIRKGKFDGYWGGRKNTESNPDILAWRDRMFEKGWTAPSWSKAYGGGGLSNDEARVLDEEMARLGSPPPVVGFGLTMIGPTLLAFGNEAQKQEHLPKICSGEIRWCQGYSEPGAGSDLASLSTRAVRDGDEFVIDGQKVWTSHADESDWIFCLVRTNPDVKKQIGITFILFDMLSPGVTAKEIKLISGASPFCEVFFDAVRVPVSQVVHEIDKGWTVAKALLGFERTMIGEAMGGQMSDAEADLVSLAREALQTQSGPLDEPSIRDAIAHNAMDERCFTLTLNRIAQAAAQGQRPGPESSILKVVGSELKQRRWLLASKIAGPDALGWEGPGFSDRHFEITRNWLRTRGNTIEGGTTEVQLNIIAKHVLGLG